VFFVPLWENICYRMSRHRNPREKKSCENCGHFVDKRFCPECGQENVETRQRFYYLFTHFIEDFIHYDSKFWKTIRYLLTRPAKLTNEYLAGKRKSYMAPVTLYIFISFITFFIPAVLPDRESKEKKETSVSQEITTEEEKEGEKSNKKNVTLTLNKEINENKDIETKIEELVQKIDGDKWLARFKANFHKAIFIYMPFFAFWLWLFHNKKKWYYFDHSIFTLHYFSFILLSSLIYIIVKWSQTFFVINIINIIENYFFRAMIIYLIYYFFHSHRLVYGERKAISRLKCSLLFIINTIFALIFLLVYAIIEVFITNPNLIKESLAIIKGLSSRA